MPTPGDSSVVGREQVCSECERVTDAEAELDVQFVRERQLKERVVRDAPSDASPFGAHPWDGEVREQVVEPLVWDPDGK